MSPINKISFITLLSLITCIPLSSTALADTPAADISGSYSCNYHDPVSTPPDGTEVITIKKGDNNTYKIATKAVDSTTPDSIGVGIANKDISNAYSFIFWRPTDTATTYLDHYILKPDGSINGMFAGSNSNKAGTSTCTKSSS